jgi:hypothetical protein
MKDCYAEEQRLDEMMETEMGPLLLDEFLWQMGYSQGAALLIDVESLRTEKRVDF